MPTARAVLGAAAIDGAIYAVGGFSGGPSHGTLERYDPLTDTWTTRASMPTARHNAAVGVIGGKLYVAGGHNAALGGSVPVVEMYDPLTDTWTTKAPLPIPWQPGHAAGAVLNGLLYVLGGDTAHPSGVCDSRVASYDPLTNAWTARTSMPQPECWGAAAVANGKIYVFGGINASSTQVYNNTQIYDPTTNSWTQGAPMPTARNRQALALMGGLIYVFGGGGSFTLLDSVDVYDPISNTWATGPAMPAARNSHAAATVGTTFYAIGGSDASGYVSSNFAFTLLPPPPPNVVINTKDSGPGSLRAAIEFANAHAGPDTIVFNIPTTDPRFDGQWFTIRPTSPLPHLTEDGTTIDGTSQTAFSGDTNAFGPEIVLDGASQPNGQAFVIESSKNVIKGLVISGFPYQAILIQKFPTPAPLRGNLIRGNYVGTDPTGQVAKPNGFGWPGLLAGISIRGGVDTVIGGPNVADRNVISGNSREGVDLCIGSSGTLIQGNYIGTDRTGTSAVPNRGSGVLSGEWQGQTTFTLVEGNLISGNVGDGVALQGIGHIVRGNLIGTNAAGTGLLGNVGAGVRLVSATNALIGGTSATARNVISDNAPGIAVDSSTGTVIQGNLIGTNADGTAALGGRGNRGPGIAVSSAFTTVGGELPGAGNLISGNTMSRAGKEPKGGVLVFNTDHFTLQGNRIGTDVTGTFAIGNSGPGVNLFNVTDALIGGSAPSAANVISGNLGNGISIGGGSSRVVVKGSYIGTTRDGTAAIPNGASGVALEGAGVLTTTIGGDVSGAGNLISGNARSGISSFGASGITIQGNFIGTDAAGSVAVRNVVNGIQINGGADITIGGAGVGAGNVISGNGDVALGPSRGAVIIADVTRGAVQGNLIGTDATGTRELGNVLDGIRLEGATTGVLIGGSVPGARNVISGNGRAGVVLISLAGGPDGNTISGNYLGTDVTGTVALHNEIGIVVGSGRANIVGGSGPGAGNVTSGNLTVGIVLGSGGAAGTIVQGNRVGTDSSDARDLGNGLVGILVKGAAADNVIGGTGPGEGNVIAFNRGAGIALVGTATGVLARDRISGNAIFGNTTGPGGIWCHVRCDPLVLAPGVGLGIDLNADGVTGNDPGDTDTGPNGLQNFPVIGTAEVSGGMVTVSGALDTQSPGTATVELFGNDAADPSGFGEGQRYRASVTPGANGCFTATFPASAADRFFTGTATDAAGNTSEFSRAIPSGAFADAIAADPAEATNTLGARHTVLVRITNSAGGPVPCQSVTFTVAGANRAVGSATTDIDGRASFSYEGIFGGDDTITAASGPLGVAVTKRWLFPASTPGRVRGEGELRPGARAVDFSFDARFRLDHGPRGEIDLEEKRGREVDGDTVTALVISGTRATVWGFAEVEGTGLVQFRLDVEDNSADGTTDIFRIRMADGYEVGGTLAEGNVEIRQ